MAARCLDVSACACVQWGGAASPPSSPEEWLDSSPEAKKGGGSLQPAAAQDSDRLREALFRQLMEKGAEANPRTQLVAHPLKKKKVRCVSSVQVPSESHRYLSFELARRLDSRGYASMEYRAYEEDDDVSSRLARTFAFARMHQKEQAPNPQFSASAASPAKRDAAWFLEESGEIPFSLPFDKARPIKYQMLDEQTGVSWCQGRRSSMEDAHVHKKCDFGTFSGVFDGHGGDACAHALATHLDSYISVRLQHHNREKFSLPGVFTALKLAFVDFTRIYRGSGGACGVALVEIANFGTFCAHVGDCRAFLMTAQGDVVQLTEDMKVPRPHAEEGEGGHSGDRRMRRLCENRGLDLLMGRVALVGVNISRAIGDKQGEAKERQTLSARPKVTKVPTREELKPLLHRTVLDSEPLYIALGCDGIFDMGSTEQYARFCAERLHCGERPAQVAASCVERAALAGSNDNMTFMLMQLFH